MGRDLEGKVAIVTGGARGIGRVYGQALADAGAAVLVADLLDHEGAATAQAIEASGGRAVFQRLDVADPDSVQAMVDRALEVWGDRVDILVNNAAMFATLRGQSLTELEVDRWDRTMAVNVKGPWLCMRAVVPLMQRQGGGAIVNQSSIAAFGLPGMLDYGTSKAALIGLTKNAALELGRFGVRVNAIAPGGVATEATAAITGDPEFSALRQRAAANQCLGTAIEPADLVGALLFLVSDASRLVTGQTVVVDGGRFFLG